MRRIPEIGGKIRGLMAFLLILLASYPLFSQNKCFSEESVKKIIKSFEDPGIPKEDKALALEILKMAEDLKKLRDKAFENLEKNRDLLIEANKLSGKNILRLCGIINEKGWIWKEAIGADAHSLFLSMINNNQEIELQREFLPIIIAASKKGILSKGYLASMVDSIRVGFDLPQIFGTQGVIRNDVLYIQPLLNFDKIDEWRKSYELPPFSAQIRGMEAKFGVPVLRMHPKNIPAIKEKPGSPQNDTELLEIDDDTHREFSIETRLVNLNLRILNSDLSYPAGLGLDKKDFIILEDGKEQSIDFFSTKESPFDLVLVLDFSGSTFEKVGMIKKAAKRFVEVARPGDRIAVVAFADQITIVSDFSIERDALYKSIERISLRGGSPIWDSLQFTYKNLIRAKSQGKRNAIVIMTDGRDGSEMSTFADLIETAREFDTTIFPVYLDDGYHPPPGNWRELENRRAKKSLSLLAEETGGEYYQAKKTKDLNGIYEQVINDLGKVYSIAYSPNDDLRDGSWRNLSVKIKDRDGLIVKTRRGYYAK